MITSNTLLQRLLIKMIIILTAGLLLFSIVRTVKASVTEDSSREFHCESIMINSNDTLWGIAEEYFTNEYDDINHYVEVIMEANNLSSTTIHSGNYLIIPYYR